MLRIAKDCVAQGYSVTIYTGEWRGERPSDIEVVILPSSGWLNHQRHRSLIKAMQANIARQAVDAVVGFNRMAGLDFYYAADPCFIARAYEEKSWFYRLSSRYRFFRDCEEAVFAASSSTHILLLTERDKEEFQRWYQTPAERLHVLPPHIESEKFKTKNRVYCRQYLRQQFNLPDHAFVVLTVGSAYIRKGVDRVLYALAALPEQIKKNTWLLAVGEYESNNKFIQDAAKLGIQNQVVQAGGRPDVADLMLGADLLAHPARSELAGLVITEALTAGLPIIVTANCGYAQHVANANAGIVVNVPFQQELFNRLFLEMVTSDQLLALSNNGKQYTYGLAENATTVEANIIVNVTEQKFLRNHMQAHS